MPPGENDRFAESPTSVVLVVEDEPLIRMDLADCLRQRGLTAIEASGPDEAREVMSSGAVIDCVLTDLHMPQREDGLGLLQWLGREYPQTPVFVASGVSDSLELAKRQSALVLASFEKPYHPDAVAAAVRSMLETRA